LSYTLDLHTHSYGSPDGGLSLAQYQRMLEGGTLDYIAITDHNRIDTAQAIQATLGDHIIVGEEIMTTEGELIGLYLHEPVPAGLSPLKAAEAIKAQNGLVYVPHPFETVRSGLSVEALGSIASLVDIVETHNGRAMFQNKHAEAQAWATDHTKPCAASSDAHGWYGWGRTYTVIDQEPNRQNLCSQIAQSTVSGRTVGLGIVYPKLNRLRKGMHRGAA